MEQTIRLPDSVCSIVKNIAAQYKSSKNTKTEYIALATLEGVKMLASTIDPDAPRDIDTLFRSEV